MPRAGPIPDPPRDARGQPRSWLNTPLGTSTRPPSPARPLLIPRYAPTGAPAPVGDALVSDHVAGLGVPDVPRVRRDAVPDVPGQREEVAVRGRVVEPRGRRELAADALLHLLRGWHG